MILSLTWVALMFNGIRTIIAVMHKLSTHFRRGLPQTPFVVAAMLLAALALYGETTADQQLAEFRNNPEHRGLSCRNGWWRYSRHPNYFFEWLHWFAYPLMGWGGEYQYWLWLAPVLMFCFLYFFTGIPFTEQQALRSRGEDYRLYQKTTSMFFPWWPES
jgi:cyclopropane-fatty-acyl-phospholipid synthase